MELSSIDEVDSFENTPDDMQKWLDDQATLVSGARLQPAFPPSKSSAKSRPQSRDSGRNNKSKPRSRQKSVNREKLPSRRTPSTKSRSSSKDSSVERVRHGSRTSQSPPLNRSDSKNAKDRKWISPGKSENRESVGGTSLLARSSRSSSDGSLNEEQNFSQPPLMSKTGRRNRPCSRRSRSSSREEIDYYGGIPRRPSIQSVSSSIDSAGSLLLGRHVLVPRRDHGNGLYLGVIKSQKKDRRFGVVFCIPYASHGDEDGLEYCMQEVDIDDILSYIDLYRHAICEKDDVLVPAVLLQPRDDDGSRPASLQIDPPFAGHPYVLAVVHKGFEPRSSRITDSPSRKTSTLVVKVVGGRKPRLCDIPTGCALWISEKQARQLYSQGCHFFDQQGADVRDKNPHHEERESLCMHGAPGSPRRYVDEGDAENHQWARKSGVYRRGNSVSSTRVRDRDTENSDVSSMLERRSESSSRRSGASSSKTKRPMWQYWGKAGIPDLLDPPSHEPYMPMQVIGPTTLVNSRPGNEWPAAHFAIVNHSMENIAAQNDSTRVYEAMRQVDRLPTLSKSTDLCITQSQPKGMEEGDLDLLFKSCEGDEDGLAGLSLRELYRRRLRSNLKETKTSSACNFNRRRSVAKSVKSQ